MKAPGAVCVRVVVEATGNISKRFARALKTTKRLPRVNIVNPLRSKAYLASLGIRDKTDRVDAAGLALFGARCDLQEPHEPSPAQERLRALTRLREATVETRSGWKSRLADVYDEVAGKHIRQTIAALDAAVADLERDMRKILKGEPEMARQVRSLRKITGIGFVTAATITTELGDLNAYSRAKIVAQAGLFPKAFESGKTVHRRPRLACGGGGHVRRALYMCATSLFRSKSPLRQYLTRHIERPERARCRPSGPPCENSSWSSTLSSRPTASTVPR